jgi:hypothetical protein
MDLGRWMRLTDQQPQLLPRHSDVFGTRSLRATPNLILNHFTFPQFLERHTQDGGEVEEQVLTLFPLDKPKTSINNQLFDSPLWHFCTSAEANEKTWSNVRT